MGIGVKYCCWYCWGTDLIPGACRTFCCARGIMVAKLKEYFDEPKKKEERAEEGGSGGPEIEKQKEDVKVADSDGKKSGDGESRSKEAKGGPIWAGDYISRNALITGANVFGLIDPVSPAGLRLPLPSLLLRFPVSPCPRCRCRVPPAGVFFPSSPSADQFYECNMKQVRTVSGDDVVPAKDVVAKYVNMSQLILNRQK
ncbi:hypothetical protein L2E82_05082 [Cichorium intybus]|uniref:Uncharacterized protein n=1 Tax=Cichorium intybus TaxID=13427 RepID=A0ACB9H7M5_CICIN|nr:hypothetical protein L2E82_05082 [Cichorium intybus]